MRERRISAIPCRQNSAFRNAMRALANEKGVNVGDMVRHALDATYANELAPLLSFFEGRGRENNQSVISETTERTA